jgi:hypothetical protein
MSEETTPFDHLSGLTLLFIWDSIKNANPLAFSGLGSEVQGLVKQALIRKIDQKKLCINKEDWI